ncbi:hypothetical protein [Burkholderia ubonensis]|uniref:hypothetical protein n=1 Tax=Burkholderia ubonensis TaxID=101571 RepID=UPI0009B43CF1|nr:hypothetical protein [Burkholderia ubonensis]
MTKKKLRETGGPVDVPVTASLLSAISAVSYQGLSVVTPNGEPATLAVIDRDGNVIEAGPSVAQAVWNVSIGAYRNFLMGTGHLRVLAKPAAS